MRARNLKNKGSASNGIQMTEVPLSAHHTPRFAQIAQAISSLAGAFNMNLVARKPCWPTHTAASRRKWNHEEPHLCAVSPAPISTPNSSVIASPSPASLTKWVVEEMKAFGSAGHAGDYKPITLKDMKAIYLAAPVA